MNPETPTENSAPPISGPSTPPIISNLSQASPTSPKKNNLPLIIFIIFLICVFGITLFLIMPKKKKKTTTQYANPFSAQEQSDSQAPTQQQPSPTYANPFSEPSPTYANPFNDTTSPSSSTPYQNPFEGTQ